MSALRSARRARAGQEKPGFRRFMANWAKQDAREWRAEAEAMGRLQDAVKRQERLVLMKPRSVGLSSMCDALAKRDAVERQERRRVKPQGGSS